MKLFYLKNCPYCRQAFQWIEELYQQNNQYQQIPIETIEESEQVNWLIVMIIIMFLVFLKVKENFMKEQ